MLKAFHILRLLKSENVSDSATVVHIVNAPYLFVNLGNFSTPPIVHILMTSITQKDLEVRNSYVLNFYEILMTVYHSERFRSQK